MDSTGTQVVSYTYSPWGELLSTTGSLADTIGQKNPRAQGDGSFVLILSAEYDILSLR